MASTTRHPMKATLHRSRRRRTILIAITNPWPGVPRWIELNPDDAEQRLRTVPPTTVFHGSTGARSTAAAIVNYVRRYVDGVLDKDAAEAGIAEALTEWSIVTHPVREPSGA